MYFIVGLGAAAAFFALFQLAHFSDTSFKNAQGAVLAAVVFVMATHFKWRQAAWDTVVEDREHFQSVLTRELTERNYERKSSDGDLTVYDRRGLGNLSLTVLVTFSPGSVLRVTSVFVGATVTITGPGPLIHELADILDSEEPSTSGG